MKRRNILIANDDGIYGPGLKPLIRAMLKLGEVFVVVPDSERSAASHAITLHKPFRVQSMPLDLGHRRHFRVHTTNGTPADCVRFGVLEMLKKKKVHLVVSGINYGANLGEDTVYSGTVAAVREGAMMGIPGFAVSVVDASKAEFKAAERVCVRIARQILSNGIPPRTFLNVNIPPVNHHRMPIAVTRLGRRIYGKEIPSGIDPRGQAYYWLAGDEPRGIPEEGTDIAAIKAKQVSVTPLAIDSTYQPFLPELTAWKF
jgi:5'-nucleotidase